MADPRTTLARKLAGVEDQPEESWSRDMLLPLMRNENPQPPATPAMWATSGDAMKAADAKAGHRWQLGLPQIAKDAVDAVKTVGTSPALGPIHRPSRMPAEGMDSMLDTAGAIVGPMAAAGFARAGLAAPGAELGIFGGRRGAETLAAWGEPRPLQAIDMIEAMEKAGKSRDEIWAATSELMKGTPYAGAFRGTDTKPRFEIDDSGASLGSGATLGEALSHNPLKAAYPSVVDYEFAVGPLGRKQYGAFSPGDAPSGIPPSITVSQDGTRGLSSLLHEVQHGIQAQEGFATGANQFGMSPQAFKIYKDIRKRMATTMSLDEWAASQFDGNIDAARASYNNYRKTAGKITPQLDRIAQETAVEQAYTRSAGETEARAVQARRDLTPGQRAARPPWLDYDVPESQQIVRFGNSGPQMSVEPQQRAIVQYLMGQR